MKKRVKTTDEKREKSIKVFNRLYVELEVMHFRFKSAIDFHKNEMEEANDDIKEVYQYMIDFYNDLIDKIELQRLNL